MRHGVGIAAGFALIALAVSAARADDAMPEPPQPPPLVEPPLPACLNDRDLRSLVESGTVVPPITAIRAARAEVAGDAVGARLCRDGREYVYRVTVLTKDGKIVRVGVDGRTGRPAERR